MRLQDGSMPEAKKKYAVSRGGNSLCRITAVILHDQCGLYCVQGVFRMCSGCIQEG